MIELFARPAAAIDLPDTDRYVRLEVEDALVHLVVGQVLDVVLSLVPHLAAWAMVLIAD